MAETTTRIYELQVRLAQQSLGQMKQIKDSVGGMESALDQAGAKFKQFGASLVASLSVGALVSVIDSTIQKIDELGATAQRVGMDVETFSALQYAAEQSDLAMADLAIGLKELQKSMGETETKGAKVLDALGIDKTKPQIEVLKDFAKAFPSIRDEATKTRALLEVFGKSGLALRPLLEQGAAGIEKLMEAAKELGFVVSDETAKKISDLDNVLKNVKKTSDALARSMVEELAPALKDVADAFQLMAQRSTVFRGLGELLGGMFRLISLAALQTAHEVTQVGTVLGGLAAAAVAFVTPGQSVSDVLGFMRDDLKANQAAFKEAEALINGHRKALDTDGETITSHTEATKDNTNAVKDAMAERKKAADEFKKLEKALSDQLFRLKQTNEEWPAYAEAMRTIAEAEKHLTKAQHERALQWAKEIALQEKANKEAKKAEEAAKKLADTRKEAEGIIAGLRSEEEKLFDDLKHYEELMLVLPDLEDKLREAYQRRIDAYTEGQKKAKTETSDTAKMLETLADKVDGYAKSMADSIIEFASGTADAKTSFRDMTISILKDMAKMATQMLLIEPLMKSFKQMLTGYGGGTDWSKIINTSNVPASTGPMIDAAQAATNASWFRSAKGNAFSSRSLSKFSGGVYDSPQFFQFAKGGVFAEAGPEAVMPLTRGSDGSLGVDASGAGVTVNVYNESKAEVTTQSKSDVNGRRVIELMVKDAVSAGIRSGAFDNVMGTTYGLNRQGAR